VLVDHDPFGEFPGGLVLQSVAKDERDELRRYRPDSHFEARVEVGPLGPESSFPHCHKNIPSWGPRSERNGVVPPDDQPFIMFEMFETGCKVVCHIGSSGLHLRHGYC
jgi:hypothetical protein